MAGRRSVANAVRGGARQGPATGAQAHADGPAQKQAKGALAQAKQKVRMQGGVGPSSPLLTSCRRQPCSDWLLCCCLRRGAL